MPLIGPEGLQGGRGSLRDWLRMCKAEAVRSSWEFVVVGLNFLFVSHPLLEPGQQVPVATAMGSRTGGTLVGLAPGEKHTKAAVGVVCGALSSFG